MFSKNKNFTLFQKKILAYYSQSGRDFSWRRNYDPYRVLVSEFMLQQTQVQRVETKFEEFLNVFPTLEILAQSQLRDILIVWKGLGYNRRAKFLHDCSRIILENYKGNIPEKPAILEKLPGIGANTAGSIAAFAYNYPSIFIETNIRSVYLHCFFNCSESVKDSEIFPLIEQTLYTKNPRIWYWALMDFGTHLKKTTKGINLKSHHYSKQSEFQGSNRKLRSEILHLIAEKNYVSVTEINDFFDNDERIEYNVSNLLKENIIESDGKNYHIKS